MFRVSCFVFRVLGSGLRGSDFDFRVSVFNFRALRSLRISGFEFRVPDFGFLNLDLDLDGRVPPEDHTLQRSPP